MDQITKIYKALADGDVPFEGGHNIHTPRKLVEEVLGKIQLDGNILVMFNIEFVVSLVYTYNIDPANIRFYSDHTNKNKICDQLGVKYIDSLESDMKFDVILSNPPYDRGIKTNINLPFHNIGPHSAFSFVSHSNLSDGGVYSVVLPCNFMCLPSARDFRDWFIKSFEIEKINIVDNTNKRIFDIGLSDIVLIQAKKTMATNNTKVIWNDSFLVDLTKYDIWPMYKTKESTSIFDKLMFSRVSTIPFTGGKDQAPTRYIISTHLTRLGQRENPEPKKMFVKDQVKDVNIPVWFGFSSEQEKDFYWEWLGTDHYAYVLSLVQSTPKNQPFLFQYLGEHNFKDNNFENHFFLTLEEKNEIEKWKTSFNKL
jgi:hypothetical protein